ncbi:MAG: ABC transporter permease subunit [Treponemataceae bacterium]|nr:ABC transporter permease subunit [Treponemataceae bacterium]
MNKKAKLTVQKAISVILALAVWQIASMVVGMDILLVSPLKVIMRLGTIWLEDGFITTLLFSLVRITSGCLLAIAAGIILALIAGRFHIAEVLLWPYVITIKSVPVASFIILCLIWLSFNQLTVFIAFLIVFPVVYSNVLQGIKSTDENMLEMAFLYRMPWRRRFLYIYLPSIKPYVISASSVSMGMAWKAGVAAEVIGVVNGSIGEKLYESKIYFLSADLFAWTIIIVLLSVGLEKILIFLIKVFFKRIERI